MRSVRDQAPSARGLSLFDDTVGDDDRGSDRGCETPSVLASARTAPSQREPMSHWGRCGKRRGRPMVVPTYLSNPVTNSSLLTPNSSLPTLCQPLQGIPIRYRPVFGLKTPEKRRFWGVGRVSSVFLCFFCENGAKNTQKALKKIPVYVTIIICGGMSPFPQNSTDFDLFLRSRI